jgi:hypothetical protein
MAGRISSAFSCDSPNTPPARAEQHRLQQHDVDVNQGDQRRDDVGQQLHVVSISNIEE